MKRVRTFASNKTPTSLKMGHFGAKTRSQGQILETPCECPRGCIFSLILIKLGQNVRLNEIWKWIMSGQKEDH